MKGWCNLGVNFPVIARAHNLMASMCRQWTGVGDLTEESRRDSVDDREENECV